MYDDLRREYRAILESHLREGGEAAVLQAYDFARRCLREGLAPDDVMALHVDLVEHELPEPLHAAAMERAQALLLEIFMAFSLSYRQNMADLERANQDLERVSRFKSRMLSMVAHDLTNHVTAIKLLTTMTLKEAHKSAVQERLRHMLTVIDEEQQLIDRLLDLGRIESGRLQVDLQPLPLIEVLERSVELARKTTSRHTFSLVGPPTLVLADRARMQQVVDNLLGNAVKYSPEGGAIDIVASTADGRMVVEIRDRGLGIPSKDLPHLFEPFYRGTAEGSSIQGTGLGLAIVKSLLSLQNGTIEVESRHGQGSTFRFTLPLAPAQSRRTVHSSPSAAR